MAIFSPPPFLLAKWQKTGDTKNTEESGGGESKTFLRHQIYQFTFFPLCTQKPADLC